MTGLLPAFGVLAAVVGVFDTIPYVRDMLRGSTSPHRGTWLIWSVLGCTVFVSQAADGATWSLVVVGSDAVLTTGIFLLSLRLGSGGVGWGEGAAVCVAGAGVLAWWVTDEPVLATLCVVVADLVGVALMAPKAYRDPSSETPVTYALAGVGGFLAALAVGALDPSLLLYPTYYCVANGALAVLILRRRATLAAVGPVPVSAWACAASGSAGARSG
jgi:hypothetical protein